MEGIKEGYQGRNNDRKEGRKEGDEMKGRK